MDYSFNLGWLFGGLAIIVAGGAIVIFYRQISENFANGVSSYERVKLFGIITIVVGFLLSTNLLPFILTWLVKSMFKF